MIEEVVLPPISNQSRGIVEPAAPGSGFTNKPRDSFIIVEPGEITEQQIIEEEKQLNESTVSLNAS